MKPEPASFKRENIPKTMLRGMSLIEVIVVTAILAILLILAMFLYRRHLSKARDAQRKDDLAELEVAFEDYYNDVGCYPDPHVLLDCGGDALAPYIKSIPCDPLTEDPYLFFSRYGNACMGYKVLTKLEMDDDQDIEAIGCDFDQGCGWDEDPNYNYGIAVGDEMLAQSWDLGGSTDEQSGAHLYCIPEGGDYVCHGLDYGIRITKYNCPTSYQLSDDCVSECINEVDVETGEAFTPQEYDEQVTCEAR